MTYSGTRDLLSLNRRKSLQSQISVAAKLGISQSQYSYIENGYANPDQDTASKLIEMFDLPNDYFDIVGDESYGKE